MDWQQVEHQWQQFQGFAKKQWRKLSDDDLAAIGGKRAALVHKLQVNYDMTATQASACADQWLRLSQDSETVELRPGSTGFEAA